jgi:hypothetical protein
MGSVCRTLQEYTSGLHIPASELIFVLEIYNSHIRTRKTAQLNTSLCDTTCLSFFQIAVVAVL